ncbi:MULTISPECIES: thioesterase family protein [unclassified Bradyrhizobium]|uniref:acyl-CoA thioesterase n=1 Tax=unclassified Bradyrhizobium TaxID=2631580 RepID=UPI0015C90B7E|nr:MULTISPECIES: thioesterase family protein [unclassified Bradyrhizobium]MBB4260558.1 acyl-CoA thioester hydrolase [Bradyrhizobium sp. CIR3A]NYG46828.1 acyl-CoA thioester hydrolase [Bradyrhizobium sp. IAR9]
MTERAKPHRRAEYAHFQLMTTRWMDNDAYSHLNNTVYYALFDSAVGQYLIEKGFLDVRRSQVIGLVAETKCRYFREISFPSVVHVGLRVGRQGNTSITYEIALFTDDGDEACAQGYFVHVYVDRASKRPVPLPDRLKAVVAPLHVRGHTVAVEREIV